jgi:hypothetical protein
MPDAGVQLVQLKQHAKQVKQMKLAILLWHSRPETGTTNRRQAEVDALLIQQCSSDTQHTIPLPDTPWTAHVQTAGMMCTG